MSDQHVAALHPLIEAELASDGFDDPPANLTRILTAVCEVLDSKSVLPAGVDYTPLGELGEELVWRAERTAGILSRAMDLDTNGAEFFDIEELTVADLQHAARALHSMAVPT